MIISHKLKCIYIKLAKVAGTSFEIALSKYCGKDDIITPIDKKDEAIRESLGYRGPQNYKNSQDEKLSFSRHITVKHIRNRISPDIWDNYLKIATVRCPYDTYISFYYNLYARWWKRIIYPIYHKKSVDSFDFALCRIRGLHMRGKIMADFLIRYEYLNDDVEVLETKIACPGLLKTFQSINAKTHFRPRGTSIAKMYSKYPKLKSRIDKECRKTSDKQEFFRIYWPMYKAKLEKAIKEYQSSL